MKHKVGDKVKIKSLNWYMDNKTSDGVCFDFSNEYHVFFIREMSQYCGKIATIEKVTDTWYQLDVDDLRYNWQDYMLEDMIHQYAYKATDDIEHNKKIIEYLESLGGANEYSLSGSGYYYISENGIICCCNKEFVISNGYILTEFKEQNTIKERVIKLDLETAKEWYNKGGDLKQVSLQVYKEEELRVLPKTWKECCKLLNRAEYINTNSGIRPIYDIHSIDESYHNILPIGLCEPMLALCQLLVCRDVYRQGWKPNWNSPESKYCIICLGNSVKIRTNNFTPTILAFQNEDVRDQFLENFKDLIEEVRNLI